MRKIGIDARFYSSDFTGIGRYIFEIVNRLPLLLKNNKFYIFLNKKNYKKFIETANVKKVLADFPHYSFAEQFKFLKIVNKQNLDLMHFPHFNGPIFYKKKFITTIHDLTLHFFPSAKIINNIGYKIIINRIAKKSQKIIAVSKNTKKDIVRFLGIKKEKVSVVYNGVDDSFKQIDENEKEEFYKNLGFRDYILYVGVHREHKNLLGLFKAFKIFKEKTKMKTKLILTGKTEKKYEKLYNKIKEYNLEKDVIFYGFASENDIIKLYNCAKLFVMPSFYEGFGLPLIESMKCGTPVITSNTSSMSEICEESAEYFNPKNKYDIAEKIEKVLKDEKLQKSLIKKGFENSLQYSWDKCVLETVNIYKKCLE